ncbi:unknown protein (Partial), partial [Seminavis robusta]
KIDLIYAGLNVQYVLRFLFEQKKKQNGNLKTHGELRKYKDAILWGAKVAKQRLPRSFYEEMDTFLQSYKKEFAQAKKQGSVDEQEADPITFSLYSLILDWAVESNNVFVWFWTLSQWNFMARCASIDPLRFHNFKVGQDSIIGKYDDQKADKAGEKLSEKNIYANPFNWKQCFWTGYGIYVALNADRLASDERLFLSQSAKEGSASKRYCEQLTTIIEKHETEVMAHLRPKHFNPYGLRKGAATHAVSGTTQSPSLPSVARRGEWSQGQVLDVYWHFASSGDHYLGRILAGLHPNKVGFATLPPHFTMNDARNNPVILKAMEMLYQPLLTAYQGKSNNPLPILLRCLACIVYHSDSLIQAMVRTPGHDFSKLAILHDRPLLAELQRLVTTEPTKNVMSVATGIPPHVELAMQLQCVLDMASKVIATTETQSDRIVTTVREAIQEQAWQSGHITGPKLLETLQQFQKESLATLTIDLLK